MQCNRLKGRCLLNVYNRLKAFLKCSQYYSTSVNLKPDNAVLCYSIKKVEKISELNLTAILLEHKSTGAEHLHVACDDSNNVFGVSFRTPVSNSNGIPHILEHLALCGSKKYPCRDPFFNMLNRSLSTFMNAMTGDDCTSYVFSTQNVKDFQNLMSVYLDAAFYPLLNENDFRQEGWRLEHENPSDKNSPIVLKGVVFNEMKGVFSDPNTYFYYNLKKRLFSNNYTHVSGGDPLVIPTLSWEELKQFHYNHYHPSNSRFFTYGNMPLEQHLEQIEEGVLSKFQKLKINSEVPDVTHWTDPREAHIYTKFDPLAAIPEKQHIISQSYLLNKVTDTYESFALSILGTLLIDGPSSPFYQKLIESGIGPDYSPVSGYMNHFKQSMFSVGVREIASDDVERSKEVIDSTFDEVVKTGFPEKRIKGVLHSVEMSTKHKTTKFGLSCAMGVNTIWNHGGCPISSLKVNDHVQWFLKKMEENPHFLQDKIVQYFKDNKHKLTLTMSPSEAFEAEQKKKESNLLESKLRELNEGDKTLMFKRGIELSEHQKKVDASSLPTLKIGDVKRTIEKTPLKFSSISDIPVQICEQPTNEVVYFRAMLDASSLSDDVMLLPLFCSVITQMGAGNKNYKDFDQEVQLKTGSFSVSFHLSTNPSDPNHFDQNILIASHCLERNMQDMFALWKDIFNKICLEDSNRLTQLIKLYASDMAQGITHSGHVYAMRKASSTLTPCAEIMEKTSGIAQLSYLKKLAEIENHSEVLENIKKLADTLLHQKFLRCSINATSDFMPTALKNLDSFVNDINFNKFGSPISEKVFQNTMKHQKSHFVLPLSVNFLGQSIKTVAFSDSDFARLKVAAKLLSSKYLHSQIREKGGAYGGGSSLDMGGLFKFYSYRDPNVDQTLKSFSSGVNWLLDGTYSNQDIDEAKLGVFSEVDAPVAPGSKGMSLFLSGISDEMKETYRLNILDCKREDIINAVERYLKDAKNIGSALIGPEAKNSEVEWTIV